MLPSDSASATVLVVDDDARNLDIITQFLTGDGFRVRTADDGEAALLAVERERPDVILLDVMMPGLDGFEVCRRLKANPQTVFIPVVILTALKSTHDHITGAAAGADDFLSKPFDHVELITRVRSLVRVKRLHDRLEQHAEELEQRVAERTADLRRALADLQELDRLKSEFIANVSHELRTPLLHVKGYVGLVADGMAGDLTTEQKQGLGVAKEAIARLERLVEDVIDFSQASERKLNLEPVPVADVCQSVVQSLGSAASRRSIAIHLRVASNLPAVLADRAVLTRVLRHLLDNAVKFSPPDSEVEMLAERRGPRVRLAVRDHGPGIPPEERERIFQLFYQTDGSSTRAAGGLGLGLALVKLLLEAHGSKIELESEAGKGSTFWFELQGASL